MERKKNYLIVGAGVAGLTVATHLIEKEQSVTVIDRGVNHSSIIAAGMISPLVFRRITKGWRVDDFVPALQQFYRKMEAETVSSFYHPIQIRRMFSSEEERGLWIKKQAREDFQNFMYQITKADEIYDRALNPFGSGRLKNGAYINPPVFLSAMKKWISNNGTLLTETLDYKTLEDGTFNGNHYSDVIFCEGYQGKNNPWFGHLPLNQTKGETLTIHSEGIPEDESVNRKCFILPLGNQQFKVGSTYEWHTTSLHTTEKARKIILDKAAHLTNEPIAVIDQAAGIRPTVEDRRPLIGTHSEKKNYHIFNGLGTKGYLLAPKLAEEFVDYLINRTTLNKEMDIKRFER